MLSSGLAILACNRKAAPGSRWAALCVARVPAAASWPLPVGRAGLRFGWGMPANWAAFTGFECPSVWATLNVRAERLLLIEEHHQSNRYKSKEINKKVDWLVHLRLAIESQSRH